MSEDKKRKQHFVWEHYLQGWASDDRIWCQMPGRRFRTNTENAAQERDFYRLMELTEVDLSWVERFAAKPTVPELRRLAAGWIDLFRVPFALQRAYLASGRKDAAIEKELDIAINNLEENMHMSVEKEAIPLLAALKERDHRIFASDDDWMTLAFYLGLQYMRTPRIMQDSIAAIENAPFNVEASWGLLRTIFATNIGWSLFAGRRRTQITFVEAVADAEFVTGDQPLINVHRSADADTPPTQLELWYPLSPTRGVIFACDAGVPGIQDRVLTSADVSAYNRMIVARSYRQVYAANEAALDAAFGT